MLHFFMSVVFLCTTMMFNGLMVYGDSDTSDFTKESLGASSEAGSAVSAGSDERARSLESKLMATLQVLKNKEETVRVQAESLALAEARIAALTARRRLGTHRAEQTELHSTRTSADGCCVETTDVTAQTQEVDYNMVSKLQDNLSIIEELYRECFYETVKQEEVIERLRKSYLDVRLTRRAPARCQDIALEVDNLKSEISDFLNSSNHDSGMWERGSEPAADAADELRHIAAQLLRLRALLEDDCTCGLEEENLRLKKLNDSLEAQLSELRERVSEMETLLEDKENIEHQYRGQIDMKDREISSLQRQLAELEESSLEQRSACSSLNQQVQQLQVLLHDRSEELLRSQKQCEEHASVVTQLKGELSKAENVTKENGKVRAEVSELSSQVSGWRRQLADGRLRLRALGDELQRTREHSRHVEQHYTEMSALAAQLQEQLREARARGAALCAQAQRALCAVRHWLRKQRQRNRDQEQKIKEQDILIQTLQQRRLPSEHSSSSDLPEPCCSKHLPRARRSEHRCTGTSETASCSKSPSLRPKMQDVHTSASEMSSCQPAPTPPRRLRKKPMCDDTLCQWPSYRDASAQEPMRADVDTRMSRDSIRPCSTGHTREVSPTDELLERVERAHEALAAAHRRWRRAL